MDQNIKVAVDAIVFAYANEQLKLLLIQPKYGVFKEKWALPGGFVTDQESLQAAVHRELKEETGVEVSYLEQLYTFGDDVDRDPRGRVISVAYFALVNPTNLVLTPDTDAALAEWYSIDELPELAYDHGKIIKIAVERLKSKLQYQPIGFDLLNKDFPFSDLEHLYGSILGQKIERRNFRKKMLSFGILKETNKIRKEGSGRPAKLYRFNQKKYQELEAKGFHFEIKLA